MQKNNRFSIVIVTKDSSNILPRLLMSIEGLSDDIVVCDTGSTDNTIQIASKFNVNVHSILWEGYGESKNKAIQYAKYDWILSMDSDEKLDDTLYHELKNWSPDKTPAIYHIRWKNFIGNRWIKNTGGWKGRLFNKKLTQWDKAIIHEEVSRPSDVKIIRLKGFIEHYTHKDFKHLFNKYLNSAMITAEKQYEMGKRSSRGKILIKPIAAFFSSYIFRLGFQNGFHGLLYAIAGSYYSFMKYTRLLELNRKNNLS